MNDTKEVYYHIWCEKCKYSRLAEDQDPCNECLSQPSNIDSHKPVKFESKEDE